LNRGNPDEVCRPYPTLEENLKNMSAYILWNPKSRLPPTVTFEDRGKAIKVAGRMAADNPGESFYVCKLVNVASKAKPVPQPILAVQYTDLEKAEEVPF
jgi:hypothetical protein